jgi:small subunit ribosomal protein S6e
MKLLISYPATGCTKVIDIDDENKLRGFLDKRMAEEVSGDTIGDEFKGYVFKIVGGQDKQGFPMKQGVLVNTRARLLLKRGDTGFQAWRGRDGERRRKSIRGCIVAPDIAVLDLVIVKKGEQELPGITDISKPRTFGPKRASKIRKLFNLSPNDDVRKYVIKHKKKIGKKEVMKGPKIQRLLTTRKLRRRAIIKKRTEERKQKTRTLKANYEKLLAKRKAAPVEAKKPAKKAKTTSVNASVCVCWQ